MRIEHDTPGGLHRWLSGTVSRNKYDLYLTDDELIAVKNVSTSPKIHAVVRDVDPDNVDDIFDEFTRVQSFDWSDDVSE